jgi:hypothetical protein
MAMGLCTRFEISAINSSQLSTCTSVSTPKYPRSPWHASATVQRPSHGPVSDERIQLVSHPGAIKNR